MSEAPRSCEEGPRIRLALRYDDVSNGSPHDLDRFVCGSVVEAGLAITAAVIPFGHGPEESRAHDAPADTAPEPDAFAVRHAALSKAAGPGRVEIALHGFDHSPVGQEPRGRPAEFGGQPEAEQRDRLRRGMTALELAFGVQPTTFVPPWNRYDSETVQALETLGFHAVSAGRDPPPGPTSMRFLPATAALLEIEPAVRAARRLRGPATIVGLLHPYDFVELGTPWGRIGRDEWSRLLAWLAACPDIGPWTIGDLAAADPDLGADRGAAYAAYHASAARVWVPGRSPGSRDRPVTWYPTARETRALARRRLFGILVRFGGIALGAGSLGWLSGASLPASAGTGVGIVSTLAAVGAWVRAVRGDGPHFRGLAVGVAAVAFSLGVWIARAVIG